MARSCVFCGGSPLTLEHAWPKWVVKRFEPGAYTHTQTSDRYVRTWDDSTLKVKVRRVCAGCNNGWMSDLESQAKPLLVPMIEGKRSTLTAAQQQLVAFWGTKTALMLGFTHPESVVAPVDHFRALYANRKPPDDSIVWLSRYVGPTHFAYYRHRGMIFTGTQSGEKSDAYAATFTIEKLVLRVLGYTLDAKITATPRGQVRHVEEIIWPLAKGIVSWPPRLALDDESIELFADAFVLG